MDVSCVSQTGHAQEVQQTKTASQQQQQPSPPPEENDCVAISDEAKALSSQSVLDE